MPRLRTVTPMLKTVDMAQTLRYYTATLGFTVRTLWPEAGPTFCLLEREGVLLSFFADKDGHYQATPCLTGQITFDVEDVKTLYAQLEGKVEVLWGPEVYSYGRREFAVRDVNGYTLTFSEETEEPPTSPEP
jgi:uncharacterized glyoxalase superfamily protein PhnB